MGRLKQNAWFLLAILFAAGITYLILSNIILNASHAIPELGGDGGKNTFTYLYHSMYGKGYWFEGMNYPYGEHIVYTDGQPILSVLFASLHNVTAEQALTVLWLLIGCSYFLSFIFLYKILCRFKVSPFPAILFAGLIGLLSPQLPRLQGHYALSYTCIIPMLFYWTIQYHDSLKWRYPVYIFLTGAIMSFFHPYYAAMMLVWAGAYSAGYALIKKEKLLNKAKATIPLLGAAIAVLAVVAVVMKLTDPITDRPVTPFNAFYETCTHIKNLITSVHSPFWQAPTGKPVFYFVTEGGEGYCYIGVVIFLTLAGSLFISAGKSLKQKRITLIAEDSGFSPVWLVIAVIALLFSMGVPFIWHMEWLMDYISFFKQFRSLGRFSWIFYYIAAVYTAVAIHNTFRSFLDKRRYLPAYALLLTALSIWGYEANGYVKYAHWLSQGSLYNYRLLFSVDETNWENFLKEHNSNKDNFQGILLLPFFHVGTEKLWLGDPDWLMILGGKAALQLHLPIVDVMMSRSSWSAAMKQVKTAGGRYVEKPLLDDIKSNKPFLLMQLDYDTLDHDQKVLLEASDLIGLKSQCYVYACYPDRLRKIYKSGIDSISRILPFLAGTDTIIGNATNCYINHMDDGHSEQHIFGAGGGNVIEGDSSYIATLPITPLKDSELYEFSCWVLLGNKDYRSPFITLQQFDRNGKMISHPDVLTKRSTDNYGMWFRTSAYFQLQAGCTSIRCNLINMPHPSYFGMDEIQLRPAESIIISKSTDGRVTVNNHFVR